MVRKQTQVIISIILIHSLVIGTVIMARGHEDWFINKQAFGKALQDVGEMAARFGVPYSFTRSGKVIYSDGFEASLAPWQVEIGDGCGTVERDDEVSFRGAYSAKFTPSADTPQQSLITKTIPFVLSGKIGLEAMVSGEAAADDVYLHIGIRKDELYYYFQYKVILGDTTLYVKSSETEWTLVADIGGDIASGAGNFQLIKMIIDTDTLTYHSVQFNNHVYDVSGIGTYEFVNELPDMIQIGLKAVDTSGDQGIIRFDDVTFTIDEP